MFDLSLFLLFLVLICFFFTMELHNCSDSLQDQLTLHGGIVENTECAYLTANGFKLVSKRKSAFGKTFGLQNGPVNHSHVNLIKLSVLILKKCIRLGD